MTRDEAIALMRERYEFGPEVPDEMIAGMFGTRAIEQGIDDRAVHELLDRQLVAAGILPDGATPSDEDPLVVVCGPDTAQLGTALAEQERALLVVRDDTPPGSVYTMPLSSWLESGGNTPA